MLIVVALAVTSVASSAQSDATLESVRTALREGRYADAESGAERLLPASARARLSGLEELARADVLVEALVRNGTAIDPHARTLAEQIVRARTVPVDPSDTALAVSLRNLGDVLLQAGEYSAAVPHYKHAIAICERAGPAGVLDLADTLDHLARALAWPEHAKEGLADVERALAIKERTLAATDVRIAQGLEVLGLLRQRTGDYTGARPALERALTLREAATPVHPETAAILGLLSDQAWFEGNLSDASQFAERAVAMAEQTLRPDHPDRAVYLRSLALAIEDQGDLSGAQTLRNRALDIAERSLGPEHPLVALQLNDVALGFGRQADYATARRLLERALRIYERRLGRASSGTAAATHNLAVTTGRLGDVAAAQRLFIQAMEIWQRTLGPRHPYLAYPLSALADLLNQQRRYGEARVYYERTLAIRERALGRQHPAVASTLVSLATCLGSLHQLTRADALSRRALRILRDSGAGDTLTAADALKGRATLQRARGDFAGAQESYRRELAILERIVGAAHPDAGDAQAALATTLAYGGDATDALQHALAADATIREYLRLTLRYLPERQALEFVSNRPRGLDIALSLADADGAAAAVLLDRVVRGRTLILDEIAARRHGVADAARPDLAPLWANFIAARQRLANLMVRGANERRPGQYLALLDNARQEKEEAERALAERSATFRAQLNERDIDFTQVRAALPRGSVLVSFVRYDRTNVGKTATAAVPSYVAFVVRAEESSPTLVPLGTAAALDRLIVKWRQELIASAAMADAGERSLRKTGDVLRQRVWDPIAKLLGDATRVFVVPDGAINLVPLAALPVGSSQYLVENGPVIHYLSAERDLVSTREAATVGHGLLALGGPSFDDPTLFVARPTLTARRGTDGCGSLQSLQFEPLPGTAAEATEIAELWTTFGPTDAGGPLPSRMLIGRDANESTFKQRAPGSRILHLATHGFFLDPSCTGMSGPIRGTRAVGGLARRKPAAPKPVARVESPLLLAGLALAGANRRAAARGEEDDGILTAEEVASLTLTGVEWAVLSACDTGLGEIKTGEGVIGLRRAFQVAGAHTVIMSLWPVEDRAARQWMRALYRGRLEDHLDTADAARAASVNVLRDRRATHASTHPFFWSAFVAAGDWR